MTFLRTVNRHAAWTPSLVIGVAFLYAGWSSGQFFQSLIFGVPLLIASFCAFRLAMDDSAAELGAEILRDLENDSESG